jgi:hypothetical protein
MVHRAGRSLRRGFRRAAADTRRATPRRVCRSRGEGHGPCLPGG